VRLSHSDMYEDFFSSRSLPPPLFFQRLVESRGRDLAPQDLPRGVFLLSVPFSFFFRVRSADALPFHEIAFSPLRIALPLVVTLKSLSTPSSFFDRGGPALLQTLLFWQLSSHMIGKPFFLILPLFSPHRGRFFPLFPQVLFPPPLPPMQKTVLPQIDPTFFPAHRVARSLFCSTLISFFRTFFSFPL